MITLTDQAAQRIAQLLEEDSEATMLRVAVRPGGCAGFSYDMFFDSKTAENDRTATTAGVTVVSDPASALLLEGAVLDYRGGLESGFSITNPNAQRTCGCGSSFS